MNINNNKNMKSFDIINLQPIEFKIVSTTLHTESNKRNNNINSISKLPKNIKNKNLKINKVIDAQNKKIPNKSSLEISLFFSKIFLYLSSFVLIFNPCQGKEPLRK